VTDGSTVFKRCIADNAENFCASSGFVLIIMNGCLEQMQFVKLRGLEKSTSGSLLYSLEKPPGFLQQVERKQTGLVPLKDSSALRCRVK